MPVPINLVSGNPSEKRQQGNGLLDISFLANYMPKEASDFSVALSDQDADSVMDIWLHAKKVDSETFDLSDINIESRDVIRLKSRGLIVGGANQIKFTQKGKTVVKTMTLGENNSFLKNKKEKSYTEILASMDKRGKRGYRMASVYDEHSHLLSL